MSPSLTNLRTYASHTTLITCDFLSLKYDGYLLFIQKHAKIYIVNYIEFTYVLVSTTSTVREALQTPEDRVPTQKDPL